MKPRNPVSVADALGKPTPKRQLHPALKKRAEAVKQAHAHLSRAMPDFRKQPGHAQIRQTQAHASKILKQGGL